MNYAEVILPLPIYTTFTYSYDPATYPGLQIGSRVLVQFGKKKYYTGIIRTPGAAKPEGYEVKPILALLDNDAIVRYPQMKLWEWMAEYYLCSVGEVYKAAMPTGLKPESETYIDINPDWEEDPDNRLSDREMALMQLLAERGKMRLREIESESGLKGVAQLSHSMLRRGAIEISETVVERYRPRKETMVRLVGDRDDADILHEYFDRVSRSRQQERALMGYLELSGWLKQSTNVAEVSREQLINKTGVSAGVLKALADKGIFEIYKKKINRFSQSVQGEDYATSPLSEAQKGAYEKIKEGFREKQVMLLRGVTGSGKTEIYSHLINAMLRQGRQVLYLVPEISLTTQLTDRMRRIFGDRLLVYHSKFSDNERVDIWNRLLHSHEPLLVIGVRSSVFLPFSHLGLVIVDEEHESSYKQYDPAPRYNARDTAIMLAGMHGAKTLLGSATPSVETYWKAQEGKFGLVELEERYEGATMPDVEIIDMKSSRKKKETKGILSFRLISETRKTLSEGGQAIMFQNRRGFAPMVTCKECGWTPKCPNCDVSLVYHKRANELRCHYCGHAIQLPPVCPACGLNGIEIYGYGTERIAEELHHEFDSYRISRMDLDTTRNKNSYQELIEEFARQETDILVGTQMVTKGLDFAKVRTVGVLNADTLLNFPDFRSDERAFNMLEQVAGRAGRRQEKGKVLIQTNNPDNHILHHVQCHDYKGYYARELQEREKCGYPPFGKVINIYLKNKNDIIADKAAIAYAMALRNMLGDRVLDPHQPLVSRVALWYIRSIMLKVESGVSMAKVKTLLRNVYTSLAHMPEFKSTIIYYDVDPS